ncbi:MAG: hypothetical protein AAGI52_12040 [Bacteroidota bacterium]
MRPFLFAALLFIGGAPAASAQYLFGSLDQDTPVEVQEITALAMGDAVTAVPSPQTAFFSNPAHLTSLKGFRITVLGAQAGIGGNFRETYDFYADELGPAIEDGLDTLDDDDLQRLYAETLEIGRDQKTADVAVELAAMQFSAGPLAVGIGGFANARARAKLTDTGAGIPFLDAYSQADFLVPVVAAMDVPGTPLSVGASAAYVERRVTAKAAFVDALDPDGEKAYLLGGNGVVVGAGVTARDVGLPGLSLGMALSNIGGVSTLTFDRSWAISGSDDAPDDAAEIAELEARFASRETTPVLRLGTAYSLPLSTLSPVRDVTLAADWISGSTSEFDQALEAGIRVGAQAKLLGFLELRGGLAQGYPTAGIGLDLKVLRLDYATYSVEDGRTLGQLERRNHVVQVRLGIL